MTALARLVSHLRSATLAGDGAPIQRHWPALSWPWLLIGLLLVAFAAPAHGFDPDEHSGTDAQHVLLDGSGVPISANWVVLDARGIAAWRAQGEARWNSFTPGEVLPSGCEIETGADGMITLVTGGDQLTIAPHGRLILPVARPGQDRRLLHQRGRILMQVESRDDRDVRVDTPLLSLGIKGTTFEVLVEPGQDSVVVHEGDVEVTTPNAGDPVDLSTGEALRQPAAPGSAAVRFQLPALEGTAGSTDEPAWRLQPTTADPSPAEEISGPPAEEVYGPPPAPQPVATVGRGERARDSASGRTGSSSTGFDLGRLDELAMSWGNAAIAAVALLLLTIPALVLVHHVREQWLRRPKPTGERRRQLVRG